jgi:ornithine--oxo-acid transaminase
MAKGNFWGRSITASGACDDPTRYTKFGPFTPGFPLVPYNDLPALEEMLKATPNTVAVYLEPVQGEGGIIIPSDGYLGKVKALCEKYNVLCIADEVQTGFGRAGKLMGYMWDTPNNKPDILVLAKSISGGVTPVSGIVANDEIMMQIKPGDHGSTYGGNPLGMAVAKRAVEVLFEEGMIDNSMNMGQYLLEKNREMVKTTNLIKDVRGRGLLQGIEFKHDLKVDGNDMAKIMFKNGIITKATHDFCVRLSPSLVINKDEID